MTTINPYLNFNGNTEEAFKFYQSVFGGELSVYRFKDMPEETKVNDADKEKIMHISLPVGEHILMGSDALESFGQKVEQGSNLYISVNTESETEAKRIFEALSAGGEIEMDLQEMFWGALFASFIDKFGVRWMVNCELAKKE